MYTFKSNTIGDKCDPSPCNNGTCIKLGSEGYICDCPVGCSDTNCENCKIFVNNKFRKLKINNKFYSFFFIKKIRP